MARIRDVVVDCRHPAPLARFWAAALDGYAIAPYDEAELERLRSIGVDDPEDDPSVLVEPPGRDGVRLWFQRVPEEKVTKNRVHLDLGADDSEAEVRRLEAMGASTRPGQPCVHVIVMEDPEGNEFCVIK
jgi:hypothetical protein